MTENNKKQALVLEGSEVLANDHGMAPGMVLSKSGITYMLLPGPPSEMEPMFLSYGYEKIMNKLEKHERIDSKVLRFYGIGEAELETVIEDLLVNQTNPTIAPLAAEGEVTLRITAKDSSKEKCEELILEAEKEILSRVGKFHYGSDNTSLIKELVKELTVRKLSIAAAESLTGGMFQEQLTPFLAPVKSSKAELSAIRMMRSRTSLASAMIPYLSMGWSAVSVQWKWPLMFGASSMRM